VQDLCWANAPNHRWLHVLLSNYLEITVSLFHDDSDPKVFRV
jgi:hypothetical protein